MRFRGIGSSQRLSSHQILAWRDYLKMGWIYAVVSPAQVVKLLSFRYLATDQFVTEPVGCEHPTTVPEAAVTLLVGATKPVPACRSHCDFSEEPASIHMFSIAQYRHGEAW